MILTIILLTAFINIILGIISYTKNPNSATNRLLTALTVIFASWTIANYLSLNSPTPDETLFWIRAVMFITAPLGPVLYLFVKAFPKPQLEINKKVLSVLIFTTLIVQAIAFTPLIFSGVTITNQITPIPGPGIVLFALLFIGAPIAAFVELIRKYRRSHSIERLQLKYLIVGVAETFALLILTNFVAVVVFNFSGFVIFGPVFSLILVGFISYAIIRHRLLEVRLVLARSVVYTVLVIMTAVLYVLGIFLISQYLFQVNVEFRQVVTYAVLALFVAFTFVPLKNFLENVTGRIFYKGNYNQHDLVFQLTKIIASTISLEELTEKTLTKLLNTLSISHGAFIIYRSRRFTIFSEGAAHYEKERKTIDALYNLKKMVVFDEEKSKKTKELMRHLNVALAMPLFERSEKVGILLLGEKKSGQIYSQQDIGVLEIFASAISVAIQNAKSYEQIRKFNTTLKKEVNTATQDLKAANEKLRELGKQKDDFMAVASHELKTPVTSIKLYTNLLHNKFLKMKDAKSAESISRIDGQLNKLVNLINDLLDVTKIESGKLRYNLEFFDLNELIKETAREMQVTTEHRIVSKLEKSESILGDRDRLGQVLTNFISNAIKYSPLADQIIISTSVHNKSVTVSITDFGIGLSKQEQEKVFNRFYRGEGEKEGYPGLGLGLYISSEIISRHKGRVRVESEKGKGTTFSFILPITPMPK